MLLQLLRIVWGRAYADLLMKVVTRPLLVLFVLLPLLVVASRYAGGSTLAAPTPVQTTVATVQSPSPSTLPPGVVHCTGSQTGWVSAAKSSSRGRHHHSMYFGFALCSSAGS
jgi:hypothetical protein